jgi:hypothetical protein
LGTPLQGLDASRAGTTTDADRPDGSRRIRRPLARVGEGIELDTLASHQRPVSHVDSERAPANRPSASRGCVVMLYRQLGASLAESLFQRGKAR